MYSVYVSCTRFLLQKFDAFVEASLVDTCKPESEELRGFIPKAMAVLMLLPQILVCMAALTGIFTEIVRRSPNTDPKVAEKAKQAGIARGSVPLLSRFHSRLLTAYVEETDPGPQASCILRSHVDMVNAVARQPSLHPQLKLDSLRKQSQGTVELLPDCDGENGQEIMDLSDFYFMRLRTMLGDLRKHLGANALSDPAINLRPAIAQMFHELVQWTMKVPMPHREILYQQLMFLADEMDTSLFAHYSANDTLASIIQMHLDASFADIKNHIEWMRKEQARSADAMMAEMQQMGLKVGICTSGVYRMNEAGPNAQLSLAVQMVAEMAELEAHERLQRHHQQR